MKRSGKAEKIIDVALSLLKNEGDYGVTMRQVAVKAEMSLSNVQYYFKQKDDLLKAMADRYFNACLQEMSAMRPLTNPESIHSDLTELLKSFLSHGLQVSEMCRIFREYWAISTRNSAIDAHIKQYYREMVTILSELLRPVSNSDKGLSLAVSIIIPYVEGYSVTALSMPEDIDSITEQLAGVITALLTER